MTKKGDISPQDLLTRIDTLTAQLIDLVKNTSGEVKTLQSAIDIVNLQKQSRWHKYRHLIFPGIFVTVVFLIMLFGSWFNYCGISLNGKDLGGSLQRCVVTK